jgi:hypothetical protein
MLGLSIVTTAETVIMQVVIVVVIITIIARITKTSNLRRNS